MEYIKSTPVNLNVYIDEFHTRMKLEFEASINKIYKEEINVYSEVIETIVKLPFIQKIIDELSMAENTELLKANDDVI